MADGYVQMSRYAESAQNEIAGSVVGRPGLPAAISTRDQLADQSKIVARSVNDQC